MKELYTMAEGQKNRYPKGFEPYQLAARLLEEAGEVAKEINHHEGSGIKRAKYGEPSRENLAAEIKHALAALAQIALYYGVEKELESSINESIEGLRKGGWI